jgi:hypothetical protein
LMSILFARICYKTIKYQHIFSEITLRFEIKNSIQISLFTILKNK